MASEARPGRVNVAIIFGGRSGEHEVSLASARSVVANLDPDRYTVVLVGITKEGKWILPADGPKALAEGFAAIEATPADIPVDYGSSLVRLNGAAPVPVGDIDVVFPVLHGTYGEDGTVQGLLELSGLPYVGSGVLGSAVGMDKAVMKALFNAAGLRNAGSIDFKRRRWEADRQVVLDRSADEIGFPCFVKPANLGSSVGISKVKTPAELPAAIDLAAEYDVKVLVEESIEDAHEIECSVLGNDEPEASVLGEVIPSREFYSYEAKYVDDGSDQIIPALLPDDVTQAVRAMAVQAFKALDCSGLGRVDFLVKRHTHEIFLSEVNTMPGFTKISMYPKLWEATGVSYPDLLDRVIQLALQRHAERSTLKTSYE